MLITLRVKGSVVGRWGDGEGVLRKASIPVLVMAKIFTFF